MKNEENTPNPDDAMRQAAIWALRNPSKIPADLMRQWQTYAADQLEGDLDETSKQRQQGLFVTPTPDRPKVCRYCGDDRTDKGSLICASGVFCNDDHFILWHDAYLAKRQEDSQP